MTARFPSRRGRGPARMTAPTPVGGSGGTVLGGTELAELVRALAADPASLLDYVGPRPKRDANGNVLIVAGAKKGSDIVLTPTALTYADGHAGVALPEALRQAVSALGIERSG